MKQEELTQGIREGINQSRDDFANQIIKASLFCLVIVAIITLVGAFAVVPLVNKYNHNKCMKNPEECFQITMVAERDCFPYENLNCAVIVGDSTNEYAFWSNFRVCGYQEANALFENMKPRFEEDVIKTNKEEGLNFKIKRWECN